jgi:site-specific DNA-methyltransferase (adenine-specific)
MNVQEWISEGRPRNVILHGDCMDLMAELKDKEFSLACVDPPYGIDFEHYNRPNKTPGLSATNKKTYHTSKYLYEIPNKKYFDELFRITKNQIIWGGNYFINYLNNTSCMIIWDKKNENTNFADAELAWTSFNTATRIFKYRWNGMLQENMKNKQLKIHPTEKPIDLSRWILQKYAKPGDTIIDTHSGSASLACACHLEHFNFIAIEKDYDYWKTSVERYENVAAQGSLF